MTDFNNGMSDADGKNGMNGVAGAADANEAGGQPGAGEGSPREDGRPPMNGQTETDGQSAGSGQSGQAAGSMPQDDSAPGPQMPYVENPNGFGANYVNQQPTGAPGQPGMGNSNGVPNGGVPNGQNPYGQYGPYGYYGTNGQPNYGQPNGGQPSQQYYGQNQTGPQYGQPNSYGPYTSGPYASGSYAYGPYSGQSGSRQNAQQGPYAGQQGQPGQQQHGQQTQGQSGQAGPQYGQPYAYTPRQQPGQDPRSGWYAEFSRTDFDPFKLIEEHLPQQAKNWIRAVYAVVGVAALLIGIALLVWPGPTLVVATVALAIYFVISGIVRAVTAFAVQGVPAGWRVLDVVVGVLLTIGGVVMLKNTALSASTLLMLITSIVGISWIMEGVVSLAESWRVPSSGWAVAYGLISVFAGFVLLVTPMQSTVFLVIFAGCSLAVMGVTALVRAFKFGRTPKAR